MGKLVKSNIIDLTSDDIVGVKIGKKVGKKPLSVAEHDKNAREKLREIEIEELAKKAEAIKIDPKNEGRQRMKLPPEHKKLSAELKQLRNRKGAILNRLNQKKVKDIKKGRISIILECLNKKELLNQVWELYNSIDDNSAEQLRTLMRENIAKA